MTRRRWIADEFSDSHAALIGPHAEHLAVVLRAKVGQQFEIVAGDSPRSGRVISVTPDRVEFELGEVLPQAASPRITLIMAVFKFDRMEWAIEKCTELGVTKIVPCHR
jgi:16S rRNA (uracil1498-N3)-methyltransferase